MKLYIDIEKSLGGRFELLSVTELLDFHTKDIKLKDESSREAFFRRISEVWIYEDVGKVKKYTSVKEYFEKGKNS